MQRALQYGAVHDRTLALHCEDPALSRDGHLHEGAVSAELGVAGWPSLAESVTVPFPWGSPKVPALVTIPPSSAVTAALLTDTVGGVFNVTVTWNEPDAFPPSPSLRATATVKVPDAV